MNVTDEEDVKAGAKHIEDIDGKLDILVNKFVYGTLSSLPPYANLSVVPDLLGPAIRQVVMTQILPRRNTPQRILLNPKQYKTGLISSLSTPSRRSSSHTPSNPSSSKERLLDHKARQASLTLAA